LYNTREDLLAANEGPPLNAIVVHV
jgi:hypothetical protein